MRQDSYFLGGENIEPEVTEKKLNVEIGLFLIIGAGCIIFFITHADLLKGYFKGGILSSVLGIFIMVILSPFGAHLIARIITFFWEKLK